MNDREYRLFVLRCLAVILSVCSVGLHCRKKVVSEGNGNAAVVAEVAIGQTESTTLVAEFKDAVDVDADATLQEMAAKAEQERLDKANAPPMPPAPEAGMPPMK